MVVEEGKGVQSCCRWERVGVREGGQRDNATVAVCGFGASRRADVQRRRGRGEVTPQIALLVGLDVGGVWGVGRVDVLKLSVVRVVDVRVERVVCQCVGGRQDGPDKVPRWDVLMRVWAC